MNIKEEIRKTIEKYFNMNKEDRKYIENLLDDKKAKWTKNQLIVSLLLFHKSKEYSELEFNELKLYIEDNIKTIHRLINKIEIEYKKSLIK
jgi:hypothetical protein